MFRIMGCYSRGAIKETLLQEEIRGGDAAMVLHDSNDSAYHPAAPLMGFPEVCRGRPGRSTNAMAELYPELAT